MTAGFEVTILPIMSKYQKVCPILKGSRALEMLFRYLTRRTAPLLIRLSRTDKLRFTSCVLMDGAVRKGNCFQSGLALTSQIFFHLEYIPFRFFCLHQLSGCGLTAIILSSKIADQLQKSPVITDSGWNCYFIDFLFLCCTAAIRRPAPASGHFRQFTRNDKACQIYVVAGHLTFLQEQLLSHW